jgi:hypothetical protein
MKLSQNCTDFLMIFTFENNIFISFLLVLFVSNDLSKSSYITQVEQSLEFTQKEVNLA